MTQFELLREVLRNLNNYDLSATSKLVLIALVDRLPNIYPSQSTLAKQLGISLASVKRAIKDLRTLEIIKAEKNEKTDTLNYTFTDKLTPTIVQIDTFKGVNLSHKETIVKKEFKKPFKNSFYVAEAPEIPKEETNKLLEKYEKDKTTEKVNLNEIINLSEIKKKCLSYSGNYRSHRNPIFESFNARTVNCL